MIKDTSSVYNISLIPMDPWYSKIQDYSNRLHSFEKSLYVHSERSIPHITLLQFEFFDNTRFLWDRFANVKRDWSVHTKGIGYDRFDGMDCIWLRVKKSSEIIELQNSLVDGLKCENLKFVNGIGDFFEPHCTLSAWPQSKGMMPVPLDEELMEFNIMNCRLALGVSGDNYQLAKVIHE